MKDENGIFGGAAHKGWSLSTNHENEEAIFEGGGRL
jgi:hypothetical protein